MKIRLWKLGDLEKGIYPTQQQIISLRDILLNMVGSSEIQDIIWGPDLNVEVLEDCDIEVIEVGDKVEHVIRRSRSNE